tara:strand:- start:161 stop:733 length:573 start_codon:yes stop_codon:yes gene_type:complete
MNDFNKIVLKNNLRFHHKPNLINNIRKIVRLRNCASLGSNIIIDQNVKILRYPKNVVLGDNVILKEGVRICPTNNNASIKIGNNTSLGYHTMIFSSKKITIGNDCMIAPFTYLVDSNHLTKKEKPMNTQAMEANDIFIDDDVWIGTGVKILSGVKIEKGAVIAAGSIVNSDVPKYSIFAGAPAKKIGIRE